MHLMCCKETGYGHSATHKPGLRNIASTISGLNTPARRITAVSKHTLLESIAKIGVYGEGNRVKNVNTMLFGLVGHFVGSKPLKQCIFIWLYPDIATT
jgi:hypothetical protein